MVYKEARTRTIDHSGGGWVFGVKEVGEGPGSGAASSGGSLLVLLHELAPLRSEDSALLNAPSVAEEVLGLVDGKSLWKKREKNGRRGGGGAWSEWRFLL